MDNTVKQIIVIRTKYPDNNGGFRKLRTGKIISQACHASMAFLSNKLRNADSNNINITLTAEEKLWIDDIFTKVCVYVETEEELLSVYENAKSAGLTVNLITDCGLTEFNSVPTNTAIAIGPHYSDSFKDITGHLPLY